jgi:hypothetical protein
MERYINFLMALINLFYPSCNVAAAKVASVIFQKCRPRKIIFFYLYSCAAHVIHRVFLFNSQQGKFTTVITKWIIVP